MNHMIRKTIVLLVLTFLISGCTGKEKQYKRTGLSDSDRMLVTAVEREKNFSSYSLKNVEKEEAELAVTEKLDLIIPDFFEKLNELTTNHLNNVDSQSIDNVFYSVSSSESEAIYSAVTVIKDNEGLYPIYGDVQIDYAYNAEKKTAYGAIYKIEVINSASTGKYNGEDLQKYLMEIGQVVGISEEDIAGEVDILFAKTEEELKNQHVVLYDTFEEAEKESSFGKKLRIAYAENGIPEKIQLYVKDYFYGAF